MPTCLMPTGAIYDDYLAASNYGYQQAMLKQYDQLVELFVQIWLVLLTGMVALWFVQLWIHHKLKREWAKNVAENEDDMKRDLWNTSDPYVLGRRKLRIQLLDLIADARDEIARPLEPYVIVRSPGRPCPNTRLYPHARGVVPQNSRKCSNSGKLPSWYTNAGLHPVRHPSDHHGDRLVRGALGARLGLGELPAHCRDDPRAPDTLDCGRLLPGQRDPGAAAELP